MFAGGFCTLLLVWRLAVSDQPAEAHPTYLQPGPQTVAMSLSAAAAAPLAAPDPSGADAAPAASADAPLRLREIDERVHKQAAVAEGRISGSLYDSVLQAGAPAALSAGVATMLAHRYDLARDIKAGDTFRLVFNREVAESGRVLETGDLLYAELGGQDHIARFYRYQPLGAAKPDFFDEDGRSIHGFLLRTPLVGARVTSGFGLRWHPILGYTRLHEGVDFGAVVGAPVLAAGDGVVEEARWNGGYGRWLKIRHDGQWETGYAHLSGWAVRPGDHVHQGQLVGFVGASGLATGPHLHFEVIKDGQKVNPNGAQAPQGMALEGRELAAFMAEKAHIDVLLATAPEAARVQLAKADAPSAAGIALRSALR